MREDGTEIKFTVTNVQTSIELRNSERKTMERKYDFEEEKIAR